jgi:predicted nicotinamide N-methyase
MVYYGNDVFPTLKAGQHLDEVTVYTAPDNTEKFNKAFKALDGEINLLNGNGARLLVVVSDGIYTHEETQHAKRWIAECNANGVAVVWIPFSSHHYAQILLSGLSAELLNGVVNPTDTAEAIGRACAKALTVAGSRNG